MDKKLSWTEHVNTKLKLAKRTLMLARSSFGSFWGPKPQLIKWLYTAVVRPLVSYACIIWGKVFESAGIRKKGNSLQRLALLMMGPVRKSTPTMGMEIIAHLVPES